MSENVLKVENVTMQFGGVVAVDNMNLEINQGEIVALIGPNGAGKTTAFNCITQFYHPDRGQVVFRARDGRVLDLVGLPVHDIIRLGLVRTFQNVEVIKELTLIDNVLIGAHTDFKATILEQALRLPRARREEREMRAKAVRALEFMGIAHLKDAPAGGQPYGVLKKVEMARTLMAQPKLIILDEPAAGLNDSETAELAETIRRMRDEYRCTILLVEQNARMALSVADRGYVLETGKIVATGTGNELLQDEAVKKAYLGG